MGFYFLCFIVIIKYNLSIKENKTIKIGLSLHSEMITGKNMPDILKKVLKNLKMKE